jgi:hypothetical protein
MLCELCQGTGWLDVPKEWNRPGLKDICPDCMGSGLAHCCEGDREQPDESQRPAE